MDDCVKRLHWLGEYKQWLIVDGFMGGNSYGSFALYKRDIRGTKLIGRKNSGALQSCHVFH